MSKNLQDIELRSEEVQEILTSVPDWMIRWGNILIFILIIFLFIISWLIKYPDVVVSEAFLTSQIPAQKKYSKVTGRIDTIFVSNEQVVEIAEPLAIINSTAKYQDVKFLKETIEKSQIDSEKLQFPIDSIPILYLGDIETAYANFENAYISYKINQQFKPFDNENIAQDLTLKELRLRLNNAKNQQVLGEKELNFIKKDLDRNQILFEKGVISNSNYENKQVAYLRAKAEYQNTINLISQLRDALNLAQKNSKGLIIEQEKEETNLKKTVLQSFNQLKQSIEQWEDKYVLKSEIKGKVTFFEYWSKNQVVNQGDRVFTIIPYSNKNYIAKLRTPSRNFGKIEKDQKIIISLENFPHQEFGYLIGNVESLSQIPDKDGFYRIDASLRRNLITTYGKEIKFNQEMRGSAEIITKDLRLIERLLYQLREIFYKD